MDIFLEIRIYNLKQNNQYFFFNMNKVHKFVNFKKITTEKIHNTKKSVDYLSKLLN